MTVSRATARFAGLGRATRLARLTRRLAGQGRRTFALSLSAATLRRAHASGLLTMGVTVTVSIRDSRGQTGSVRRALRVRIR